MLVAEQMSSIASLALHQHKSILLSTAVAALPSAASFILPPSAQRVSKQKLRASQLDNIDGEKPKMLSKQLEKLTPRVRSIGYMAIAMALHFGGYEFFRNSCLAIFTSSETGFSSAAAFPLANALVSPFSLLLLWGYGRELDSKGPRVALRHTTLFSIVFIAIAAASLNLCHSMTGINPIVGKALIGITFLFQNSYQYLLYTQHWSFAGSVLTPEEGARWFASLGGFSSIVCSIMGSMVPVLLPRTGLYGMMALTCLTLAVCLICSDRAYALAEEHHFDPAQQMKSKSKTASKDEHKKHRIQKAIDLFRRVPTLGALFCEVLSWQSLNTILGVAFVSALKATISDDVARSAYTGRFYSYVNGASAILQFLVLPSFMKFAEPKWIWRTMPIIPLAVCFFQMMQPEKSLALLAAVMFLAKVIDYSIRAVIYVMVYQPLDFESRYVGKEIIGVFGSRFGKSGMSLM